MQAIDIIRSHSWLDNGHLMICAVVDERDVVHCGLAQCAETAVCNRRAGTHHTQEVLWLQTGMGTKLYAVHLRWVAPGAKSQS